MPRASSSSATSGRSNWLFAAPATAAQRNWLTLWLVSTPPSPQGARMSHGVESNASGASGWAPSCSTASCTRPGSRSQTSNSAPTAASCSANA